MDETERDELLAAEDTMLRDVGGVLEAMAANEYDAFKVKRKGKVLFFFRVRGLDDEEKEKCRDQATKMVKNKKLGGIAVPTDFNSAKFNSLLIVAATHPDDKEYLWDNKELQQKGGALAPWQLVDKVLLSGEKARVIELIEQMSGSDDDDDLEETLKNL